MSRLSRFQKKPIIKEFDLKDENGNPVKEQLTINPLKVEDIDLMINIGEPDKAAEATHKIIRKVLKENIPDYTEEEYQKMDYSFADKILNAVMDANEIDMTDAKAKFLADIKEKQQASKK